MPEVSGKGDRLLVGKSSTDAALVSKGWACGPAWAGISCREAEAGLGEGRIL